MLAFLDKANKKIKDLTLSLTYGIKSTDVVATKARYQKIAQQLNDIAKALKENAQSLFEGDIDDVIEYEINEQRKIFKALGTGGIKVNLTLSLTYGNTPNAKQIKTACLFRPIVENMTYDTFLDSIQEGFYSTWDTAVRTGYLTGISTQKIVKNVMGSVAQNANLAEIGSIEKLKNSIMRNTLNYATGIFYRNKKRDLQGK